MTVVPTWIIPRAASHLSRRRKARAVGVLNRLIAIHGRSLVMYLADATPWTSRGDDAAVAVLMGIAADRRATVDRLGEMVLDRAGTAEQGVYPGQFAGKHDLSLRYLLPQLVEHQRQMIVDIEQCVGQLEGDLLAKAAAQEALGEAKGHLELLQEAIREIDNQTP